MGKVDHHRHLHHGRRLLARENMFVSVVPGPDRIFTVLALGALLCSLFKVSTDVGEEGRYISRVISRGSFLYNVWRGGFFLERNVGRKAGPSVSFDLMNGVQCEVICLGERHSVEGDDPDY